MKRCPECSKEYPDTSTFCTNCGKELETVPASSNQDAANTFDSVKSKIKFDDFKHSFGNNPTITGETANPSTGFAIASMVLGICSIVLTCAWIIALPCAITGLILGYTSIVQRRSGWGMAKAGVITSIVGLALVALVILYYIITASALCSIPFLFS
jgi:hypothetical protein